MWDQLGFDDIFFSLLKTRSVFLFYQFINWNKPNLRISLEELHIACIRADKKRKTSHASNLDVQFIYYLF